MALVSFTHLYYRKKENVKLRYLLDLEATGVVDGAVYTLLGDEYAMISETRDNWEKALQYYRTGELLKWYGAPIGVYKLYLRVPSDRGYVRHVDQAIMTLVNAEANGIGKVLIPVQLLEALSEECLDASNKILIRRGSGSQAGKGTSRGGAFKSKLDMALYYCDLLIEGKSWQGGYWKGKIYGEGRLGTPRNMKKAVEAWLTLDRLGIITSLACVSGLAETYLYVVYIYIYTKPVYTHTI